MFLICRCPSFYSSVGFYPAVSLKATLTVCALISLSVAQVFRLSTLHCLSPRAALTSLSPHLWSLYPLLSSLLKLTAIYGLVNGLIIQISKYLTYFLPSSSHRVTFPLYILPKLNSIQLAMKQEARCYIPAPSRYRYKITACISHSWADCQRPQNSPRPNLLAYLLYIRYLTSKAQPRGKSEAGPPLENYPDAPFLTLAITTSSAGPDHSLTHWPSKQAIKLPL